MAGGKDDLVSSAFPWEESEMCETDVTKRENIPGISGKGVTLETHEQKWREESRKSNSFGEN